MMRIVVQVLILILLLGAAPFLAGSLFAGPGTKEGRSPVFCWVSGQMFLWAGFQMICVPLILAWQVNNFRHLCLLFGIFTAGVMFAALAVMLRRKRRGEAAVMVKRSDGRRDKTAIVLWLAVMILLILQQVLAAALAYEEGDDAFYVGVSSVTERSNTMYQILPYTGRPTVFDARHGLAPFPIWIAFLSRLTGIHAATMSQIVLPVVLIAMAYACFYLIGKHLVGDRRRGLPLFLLFIELLVIFGGQSLYTSENFLLVRTAQGKAVFANIVIPFLFLLLFILAEKLQQGERLGLRYWLPVGMTMVSGCLCSTQGALMTCLLLGAGGLCIALCYRKWKVILPAAACCAVPAGFMLLYLYFILFHTQAGI